MMRIIFYTIATINFLVASLVPMSDLSSIKLFVVAVFFLVSAVYEQTRERIPK